MVRAIFEVNLVESHGWPGAHLGRSARRNSLLSTQVLRFQASSFKAYSDSITRVHSGLMNCRA